MNPIRIGMMSLIALFVMSSASKAFDHVDAFLYIKDSNGKETKVVINHDGTFQTPALPVGTYSFSWGVGRGISSPTGGSADRESSAPSVSEIAIRKSGDGPQESVSMNYTKIEMSYEVQGAREASSGLATGRRIHQPLSITKEIDMSSPKLMTDLGLVVIDSKGETVSGTVWGLGKGNKSAADAWDAK